MMKQLLIMSSDTNMQVEGTEYKPDKFEIYSRLYNEMEIGKNGS